jgi:triacylglycerol lipase
LKLTKRHVFAFVLLLYFMSVGGCNDSGNSGDADVPTLVPFDLNVAVELATLSLVAYDQRLQCIKGDAITVPEGFKLQEVIYQQVGSSGDSGCKDDPKIIPIAFIATKDDHIYLSFRGTASFSDMLADSEIEEEPFTFFNDDPANNAKVHKGFNELYKAIRKPIFEKIEALSNEMEAGAFKYNTLFVTGHSLGAALAVLAVPDLREDIENLPPVVMYNFAGPSVGNPDFVALYMQSVSASWRVANTKDVIPKLPPTTLKCDNFRYEHAASERDIKFGGKLPSLPKFSCKNTGIIEGQIVVYLSDNQHQVEINHSMCTYHDTLCEELVGNEDCADTTDNSLHCTQSE